MTGNAEATEEMSQLLERCYGNHKGMCVNDEVMITAREVWHLSESVIVLRKFQNLSEMCESMVK